MEYSYRPIGYFSCGYKEKYQLPRQSGLLAGYTGTVILNPGHNFEQALHDLEGFERIWLLYNFHKNSYTKPKVMPPRGGVKRGVFATRSPHRPNSIGMSAVPLIAVRGRKVFVGDHDLLDGTPILDIKPYIDYCDSFTSKTLGWLDSVFEEEGFRLSFSEFAKKQAEFLKTFGTDIESLIARITVNPFPSKGNRISIRDSSLNIYEIAVKSWRILYSIDCAVKEIVIHSITTGYDFETLSGSKNCKWGDLSLHLHFLQCFPESDLFQKKNPQNPGP